MQPTPATVCPPSGNPDTASEALPPTLDARAAADPTTTQDRAHALWTDAFGAWPAAGRTGTAPGALGIQATHAHYTDGFALLLPMHQHLSVAVAPADGDTEVAFANDTAPHASGDPRWHRLTRALAARYTDQPHRIAVASAVPGCCPDAYWAALAMALHEALADAPLTPDGLAAAADCIAEATARPYSTAPLWAAHAAARPFTLVDTATNEYLPVPTPLRDRMMWVLVDLHTGPPLAASAERARQETAQRALQRIRDGGFPQVRTYRDIDYRALDEVLNCVTEAQRPLVQYLVTENHRVQKQVAALRRDDGQMVGALLLMQHASRRDRWQAAPPAANALVAAVEDLTLDGIYGASLIDRGGAVLLVGRQHAFAELRSRLGRALSGPFRIFYP